MWLFVFGFVVGGVALFVFLWVVVCSFVVWFVIGGFISVELFLGLVWWLFCFLGFFCCFLVCCLFLVVVVSCGLGFVGVVCGRILCLGFFLCLCEVCIECWLGCFWGY